MANKFENLMHVMDNGIAKLGVSGIDCIVYKEHEEIFRHASGYMDIENKKPMAKDALYNIYSATKVITCVAGLQLVERGLLLLSAPLSHYLPEFKNMFVKTGTFTIFPAKKAIRVVDLFAMTAGLNYELDTPEKRKLIADTGGDFNTQDFAKTIAKEPLMFEPGQGWNYSYCHDVLAAVIEVVSCMTFGEYLQKNIFAPLSMDDSGFSVPQEKTHRIAPQYEYDYATGKVQRITSECLGAAGKRHESGGGGLITTANDYIVFADAIACGGIAKNGQRILSKHSISLMAQNHLFGKPFEDFRAMGTSDGIGYGLGVAMVTNSSKACTLVPEGCFNWGGIGGVQTLFDVKNSLSYFVAQHTFKSPKEHLNPYMLNALYGAL